MGKEITGQDILNELREFRGMMKDELDEFRQATNATFVRMDKRFEDIEQKLEQVDELLGAVAINVAHTREIVDQLIPARVDHEERISALERSNIRLRLLIDR
jgi:hypothetical protein